MTNSEARLECEEQFPPLGCRALAFFLWPAFPKWSDEEWSAMAKQIQEPGPGRSTAAAAFEELRKQIAQCNEQAHQKARKLRNAREREQIVARRERDL
jgi:hypothetical protein